MKAVFLATAALLGIGLTACSTSTTAPENSLEVVTTIHPLSELAQIVGSAVGVTTIVPAGTEPHEFEPTPKDIAAMLNADVLLVNGGGIDAWADKVVTNMRSSTTTVLNMQDVLHFLESGEAEHEEHEDHGPLDPHFWLDPQKASAAALEIAEAFAAANPENAQQYRTNAQDYERMLMGLDQEFADGLASCPSRTALVSHNAFGYMAARYNLELIPIAGLSPEEEPSAKQMGQLVELARTKDVHVVFFESLVSPRLAEVLADELGIQALPLNPLEGITEDEALNGGNYLTIMRQNLQHLRTGLQCP